jgi:hypothetical protein
MAIRTQPLAKDYNIGVMSEEAGSLCSGSLMSHTRERDSATGIGTGVLHMGDQGLSAAEAVAGGRSRTIVESAVVAHNVRLRSVF